MHNCSIIIRAYNEEQHLGKLLEGISQQTISDPEVIVVDSGSSDNTPQIGRRFGAKVLQITPQDFTFGRSLNLGISQAQHEYIVIASAHVYPVYPDWIEKLLYPFTTIRLLYLMENKVVLRAVNMPKNRYFTSGTPINPIPIKNILL